MTDSQDLLDEYRRNGSDDAFRELVARFVDLVYSTALRLVEGDTHRAEDVTQIVFVDLARLALTLSNEVRLGGWLHRHACFVAANTLRGERRRQSRERQAVEMNVLQNHSGADFSQVAPLLDEAINELGEADRTAILLRFFEQQDFRAVGQALGSNEDAARMRVTRALEKLEELLKRRGVTTSAASLGVVLMANAVQAAPVGLAVTISTAAALAGTTIAATATPTAVKAIAMTTLQKTLITAIIVAAVGTGLYETRQASTLRSQVQTLQQQQAPSTEQIQQLQRERKDATNRLAMLTDENATLKRNSYELLRLRGEVGMLRRQMAESEKLQAENLQLQASLAKSAQTSNDLETELESDPVRWTVIAKQSDALLLALGVSRYARENQGRLPTSLDQVSQYYANDPLHRLTGTNQFELVLQGTLTGITNRNRTIVVREKVPAFYNSKYLPGKWAKAYGFAGGNAQLVIDPPEGFEAWEKQHMIPQPGQ